MGDIYSPSSAGGTRMESRETIYSVPLEAQKVFTNGILRNPLILKYLPIDAEEIAQKISFEGSDNPLIPVNWRFAESVSALKAFEALILGSLLKKKYHIEYPEVKV